MSRGAANAEPAVVVLEAHLQGEPMQFGARTPRAAWVEGVVDRGADHVSLSYGERQRAMALVAPHSRHGFTVQFLFKARRTEARANKILDEVRRELTFYLLDVVGPDSWTFAQYHCETQANRLSRVHWAWHPKPVARPQSGPRLPRPRGATGGSGSI